MERMSQSQSQSRIEDRKVFVGGLGRNTTDQSLRNYFGKFGSVKEVTIPKNPEDGNPRGFAFTTFSEVAEATSALAATEHVIDGKQVDVKACFENTRRGPDGIYRREATGDARNMNGNGGPSRHGPQGQTDPQKIFVGGLTLDTTKEQLEEALSPYGEVQHVIVMMDTGTGRSKGFGFVTFGDKGICENLVKQHFIEIAGKQVEIKPAIISGSRSYESSGNQNMSQYNNSGPRDGPRSYEGPRRGSYNPRGRGGYYQAGGDAGYNSRGYGPRGDAGGSSYAGNGRGRGGPNLQYQTQGSPQWTPYGQYPPSVSTEYSPEVYANIELFAAYPPGYGYDLQGTPYAGYAYAQFTPQVLEQTFKAMNLGGEGQQGQESMATPMQGMMTGNMAGQPMPNYMQHPGQSLSSSGPSSPPQMNMHAANVNSRMLNLHSTAQFPAIQSHFSPVVGPPQRPQGFAGKQMPDSPNSSHAPPNQNNMGSGDGVTTASMKDNPYRR